MINSMYYKKIPCSNYALKEIKSDSSSSAAFHGLAVVLGPLIQHLTEMTRLILGSWTEDTNLINGPKFS